MLSNKRSRPADWVITFDDAHSLRCIVDAVSAVMNRVMFKVARKGANYFLMVDGADAAFACCVSARLQLDNVTFADPSVATDEFTFCVDCKHVLIAMKGTTNSAGTLVLEGHTYDATVKIRTKNPDQPSHMSNCELSTYVDCEPEAQLKDLDFRIVIELDVAKMREIIKQARDSHSERIHIQIFRKTLSGKERSLVVISSKGEGIFVDQTFCHEVTHGNDGSIVVRAVGDYDHELSHGDETWDTEYDSTFPMDKIEAFLKNMQCRVVTAKAAQNIPIMLEHPLGGSTDGSSHIRFLIAAVNEGD